MRRGRRVEFAGALYHVTARANLGRELFPGDFDRVAILALIGRATNRFRWRCLAYCLMDNHYHLALQTTEANLGRGMHHLNGSYAQRLNRRHEGYGHAFQDRYGAELIERDEHLVELTRYIALNPVRAGRCREPEAWPWSSYRATLGLDSPPPWLSANRLLDLFGTDLPTARLRYERFVQEGHVQRTGRWTVS